jgi:hypothetical protein
MLSLLRQKIFFKVKSIDGKIEGEIKLNKAYPLDLIK